ncbi:hypothetical protein AYI68_g3968 [Smittium mucronatum]|uniref:AB hydrolase-1 domain-containing protein n=1 Tax=Smittium mucronatum TaxID=133383 RepID=A0A1R0GYF3_9FUNG|nr:hypothetical protein AYI68_g3968 [Smittium mucronatum]
MSVSSGRTSVSNLKGPNSLFDSIRTNQLSNINSKSSITVQYSFKSSSFFPTNFLSSQPQFHTQVDLSVRNFPCLLFLHGTNPGGFDVSRWMAGGIAQAQNVFDPNSRYSALNLKDLDDIDFKKVKSNKLLNNQLEDSIDVNDGYNYFDMFGPGFYNSKIGSVGDYDLSENLVPLGLLNVSRPGYLESSLTVEDSFYAEALAIIRLLDNLSIRSVRIVAHSTAALLALEMAAMPQFRDRVRSIVMIDPVLNTSEYDLNKMKWKLGPLPSFIKNRYLYYANIRNGYDSKQYLNFIRDTCGDLAVNEMYSDLALYKLYSSVGVLFSNCEQRKAGVHSDIIKLYKFLKNEANAHQFWKLVNSPIYCISTSNTSEEFEKQEFSNDSIYLEELRKSALLNVQSKIVEYSRVYGGGSLLYPLGQVSNLILEFLRKHR